MMNKILDTVGYYGPIVLLVVVFFIVTPYTFTHLIVWQMVGSILNIILKNMIKEHRPHCKGNKKETSYGMPSGHAQQSLTVLTYILMTIDNNYIIAFAVIVTMLTLWQRYAACKHTLFQILMGSVLGICLGYYFTSVVLSNKTV